MTPLTYPAGNRTVPPRIDTRGRSNGDGHITNDTSSWPAVETDPAGEGSPTPSRSHGWLRWALPIAALLLGTTLGFVAAGGDPQQTEEYQALEGRLAAAEERISAAEERAVEAEEREDNVAASYRDSMTRLRTELSEREAALEAQEEELAGREEAVAAVEQRVAETSIGEGVWTVGTDVEPGTYRAAAAVPTDCYWEITRSGTNGGDIIENDIPGGGIPTVTLSKGQDFTNSRCGTFVKQ